MGLKKATVKLGADISQFTSKMKKASRSFKRMGKSMKRVGKTMSMSLTLPLVAFAAASVKAFDVQAKAEAKLLTALKGNEAAFKSLKKQAQELQKITLFGDEQTMQAQSMLASMGLEEEAIKRLTPLIQDMATAKGMDLKAAADLVAKSVGSSTNALSRYGIQIEGAVGSSDRLDSAVEALSGQFLGQSEAAAKAGAGGLTQLKNSFGDLMETIGGMLMPVLTKLMDKIKAGIEWFTSLDSKTKKIIITIGGILAVLGPVVALLGTMATVIGAIISPIGLAVLAIASIGAAFIYVRDNLEAFIERFKDIGWWKNAIIQMLQWFLQYNPYSLILQGFNKVLTYFNKTPIENPFLNIAEGLEDLKVETKEYEHEFGSFADSVKKTAKEVGEALSNMGGSLGIGSKTKAKTKTKTGTLIDTSSFTDIEEDEEEADDIDWIAVNKYLDSLELIKERTAALNELTVQFLDQFVSGFVNLFDKVTDAEGKVLSFGEKFKTFAGDFLKQIGKMIAQAAILAALMSVTGLGGGGKFLDLFLGNLTGKASGGPVAGNTPYIVGEVGPELFVPNSSGTIIPNGQLGGSQTIIPDVRISGSDLLLVFNKTRKEEGGVNV